MVRNLLFQCTAFVRSFFAGLPARAAAVRKDLLTKDTPSPKSPWACLNYTGTVMVALLFLQAGTGLLLLTHYHPHTAQAFGSHAALRSGAPFGLTLSNAHALGAKLIVLLALVHLFHLMLSSSYRGPRAKTWYAGCGLLALLMLTGFSGYLLPWSQQSYWASVVGTEAIRVVPGVGNGIAHLARGGAHVGQSTLIRFYALHIFLLPIAIVVLAWFHIKWVWKERTLGPEDSVASPDNEACKGCGACAKICPFDAIRMMETEAGPRPVVNPGACNACRACVDRCPANSIRLADADGPVPTEPLFPNHLLRRAALVLGVFAVFFFGVYFLSDWFIAAKHAADPLVTPDRIKPDWYFLGPYQVLKLMPTEFSGLVVLFAACLLILFLPALDPRGPRDRNRRPVHTALVWTGIVLSIVLTIWGQVS